MRGSTRPQFVVRLILLMVLVYWLMPSTRVVPFPLNLTGLIALVLGATIAVSSKKRFRRMDTAMPPSRTPNVLHVDGACRYTRNPMYPSIVLGLLGLAVVPGSWINFLFPVLFASIMNVLYVSHEDRIRQERFRGRYTAYRRRIRRWV